MLLLPHGCRNCDVPTALRVVRSNSSRGGDGGEIVEEARFEAAWSEYCGPLARYCTFSTGSSQDGEEIAAETFSRLLATQKEIRPEKTEAWLFTVAHNLCMSHHRANARNRRLLARIAQYPPECAGEAWSDSSLWEAVRKLDERSRLAVYLRAIEDRPFSEVARLVGASESAAKMSYYRAMERLRALLSPALSDSTASRAGGVADVE